MQRKIFISLNLPEKDKKSLDKAVERLNFLPVKWIKAENLHLTLSYLGHIDDGAINEIFKKISQAVENIEAFGIEFNKIALDNLTDSKLIWLTGEASHELKLLQEKIEQALGIFVAVKKKFFPHVILGRIRQKKWAELPQKPEIEIRYPLILSVENVDIMASDFIDNGQEYTLIESFPLR